MVVILAAGLSPGNDDAVPAAVTVGIAATAVTTSLFEAFPSTTLAVRTS
jgi:hypothetical protein